MGASFKLTSQPSLQSVVGVNTMAADPFQQTSHGPPGLNTTAPTGEPGTGTTSSGGSTSHGQTTSHGPSSSHGPTTPGSKSTKDKPGPPKKPGPTHKPPIKPVKPIKYRAPIPPDGGKPKPRVKRQIQRMLPSIGSIIPNMGSLASNPLVQIMNGGGETNQ